MKMNSVVWYVCVDDCDVGVCVLMVVMLRSVC